MSKRSILGYLFLAALLGSASILTGWRWLPPLLQATLIFPLYLYFIVNRERAKAVGHMLLWALVTTVATIVITVIWPERAQEAIVRGAEYRDEMFYWIDTGIGPESEPSQFVPQHALYYAVFLVINLLTLGWGGLMMGAVLLNYMNFYVGDLILGAAHPEMAAAFGWPPYAVIRVIGYVCGAVALADLFVSVILRRNVWERSVTRKFMGWSLALVLLDIGVKAVLAPHWRTLLQNAAGGPLGGWF